MPYVTVRLFADRVDADPALPERLVTEVTDAVARACGETVREKTWVVVEPVPRERWGIGGVITTP